MRAPTCLPRLQEWRKTGKAQSLEAAKTPTPICVYASASAAARLSLSAAYAFGAALMTLGGADVRSLRDR